MTTWRWAHRGHVLRRITYNPISVSLPLSRSVPFLLVSSSYLACSFSFLSSASTAFLTILFLLHHLLLFLLLSFFFFLFFFISDFFSPPPHSRVPFSSLSACRVYPTGRVRLAINGQLNARHSYLRFNPRNGVPGSLLESKSRREVSRSIILRNPVRFISKI